MRCNWKAAFRTVVKDLSALHPNEESRMYILAEPVRRLRCAVHSDAGVTALQASALMIVSEPRLVVRRPKCDGPEVRPTL